MSATSSDGVGAMLTWVDGDGFSIGRMDGRFQWSTSSIVASNRRQSKQCCFRASGFRVEYIIMSAAGVQLTSAALLQSQRKLGNVNKRLQPTSQFFWKIHYSASHFHETSALVIFTHINSQHNKMSDNESPVGSPAKEPVDDGQEQEFQDELAAADSDRESDLLSEVDENQFEDYDPETANIEDRPVDIDEDMARTLKATKRKRTEGEVVKKPREGRREKKRRDRDDDVAMDDGDDGAKKSRRSRRQAEGERRPRAKPATPEPENEDHLSPEERRKRAIDRALDAAIKKPSGTKRRKKDEIVGVLLVF